MIGTKFCVFLQDYRCYCCHLLRFMLPPGLRERSIRRARTPQKRQHCLGHGASGVSRHWYGHHHGQAGPGEKDSRPRAENPLLYGNTHGRQFLSS